MKIPVEPPFEGLWKHAYVVKNKENRNMVCLVNGAKDRTTIALARYRMAIKLGRLLRDDEQVDHIDNDKTNDSIDNLQILSKEDNIAKYQETQPHNIHGTSAMLHKGCRCEKCKNYDRACKERWKRKHPEKVKEYLKKRKEHPTIEKTCEGCGKVFYTDTSHKTARFCSRACANKARRK